MIRCGLKLLTSLDQHFIILALLPLRSSRVYVSITSLDGHFYDNVLAISRVLTIEYIIQSICT